MTGTLRITGGTLARRRIAVPPAADQGLVRPTSDKTREALFAALGDLDGSVVLDLYAGSGALGIEALSRGAARCTFVERDRRTAAIIRANLDALGIAQRAQIVVGDATKHVARAEPATFDLVLADPPYQVDVDEALVAAVAQALAPGGRFVLERDKRSPDPPAAGLSILRSKDYGGTRVVVFQKGAAPVAEDAMPKAAIYPGSFDPLTNGHIDIVERGLHMFDRVVLAIANNPSKNHLFSFDERMTMAKETLGHHKGIEFDTFDGLLVDYAKKKKISTLLRGLRALSDFEYEFQLAIMNRKLAPEIDTVFMMTSDESFYLSSRLVREVASFGADVRGMVPLPVYEALRKRYGVG